MAGNKVSDKINVVIVHKILFLAVSDHEQVGVQAAFVAKQWKWGAEENQKIVTDFYQIV